MTKEKVKMSTGRKVLIGLIVVFVVLALAVYVGGIFFFKTHFLPGSKITVSTVLSRLKSRRRNI